MDVTQGTIAKRLGISQYAVSKALRGDPGISDTLRKRVSETAGQLGYRRNRLARALAEGRTRLVGLLFPSGVAPFIGRVLTPMELALSKNDYRCIYCHWNRTSDIDDDDVSLLLEHSVDGLVIMPKIPKNWNDTIYGKVLRSGRVPTVLINQVSPYPELGSVASDDESGVAQVVTHLLELGHKRIAYIGPGRNTPSTSSTKSMRKSGFMATVRGAGLSGRATPVLDPKCFCDKAAIAGMIEDRADVTAFACYNDFIAMEVMRQLWRKGLRVPEDVSVAGYGDVVVENDLMRVPLTTVDQSTEMLGQKAVEILLAKMDDGKDMTQIKVPAKLIVRDSTGPALARAAKKKRSTLKK